MSYQNERDQFIARMTQEGLPPHIARKLLSGATTMQRLAELACSSEAADRDRVPCPASTKRGGPCLCDDYASGRTHSSVPRIAITDWNTETRMKTSLPDGWILLTAGDPRGYVVRVVPPSYAERNKGRDRFNLDSIGVPTR